MSPIVRVASVSVAAGTLLGIGTAAILVELGVSTDSLMVTSFLLVIILFLTRVMRKHDG